MKLKCTATSCGCHILCRKIHTQMTIRGRVPRASRAWGISPSLFSLSLFYNWDTHMTRDTQYPGFRTNCRNCRSHAGSLSMTHFYTTKAAAWVSDVKCGTRILKKLYLKGGRNVYWARGHRRYMHGTHVRAWLYAPACFFDFLIMSRIPLAEVSSVLTKLEGRGKSTRDQKRGGSAYETTTNFMVPG